MIAVAGTLLQTVDVEARQNVPVPLASKLGMRAFGGSFDPVRFGAAEAWLGRPIAWTVLMASRVSATEMTASVWGEMQGPNAALPKLANRLDIVMTVPLAFGTGSARDAAGRAAIRQKLLTTASGTWDAQYRLVARSLAAGGYPDAVIRLGHEMTGPFYPWSSQGNEDAYIAAFRHVSSVMKAEVPALRFEWNAARNTFVTYGPGAYPGDQYVDVIGIDTYYDPPKGDPVPFTPDVWARRYQAILQAHLDFAKLHGKPVSYAEWANGGVDEPAYIEQMFAWLSKMPASGPGSLLYHSYFNVTRQRYDLALLPRTALRYRTLFGGTAVRPQTIFPTAAAPAAAAPRTAAAPQPTAPPRSAATPTPTPTTAAPPATSSTRPPATTAQMVFDQSVTHRADQLVEEQLASPMSWGDAADLRHTPFRAELEVGARSLARPVSAQICFWQNNRAAQVCSKLFALTGDHVTADLGPPGSWWKSAEWRWDLPADTVRVLFKDPASGQLLNTRQCGSACFTGGDLPAGDLLSARVRVLAGTG